MNENNLFFQVNRFCYFVVLNEGLEKFLNLGKNFYFFFKYNFFNVFVSRNVYVYFDRYVYVYFISFIYNFYCFSYYDAIYNGKFFLHLKSIVYSQIFLFIFLMNSSIFIYKLVYKLKLLYVIINKFLLLRGNFLLISYLRILLKEMYFVFCFDFDDDFWKHILMIYGNIKNYNKLVFF